MRNPPVRLLIPIALLLLLAACGQSGPLVHPDKKAEPVAATATPAAPADEGDEKKKKDEDASQPAAAPSADSNTASQPTP
jgi:predicted small lipoprotein YifL